MKKTLLISGAAALATYLAGRLLQLKQSPVTDFMQTLSILALLVFLFLLFITRSSRISAIEDRRKAFRYFRYVVVLGIGVFLWMVFVPRHYGSPMRPPRADTRYWTLPDGSRIAYTLVVLYAADNPGKIDKLIVTGPGPIMPIRRELANIKAPDSFHLHEPYYSNAQGNREANNVRTRFMAFCALNFGIKLASDRRSPAQTEKHHRTDPGDEGAI